MKKKIQIVAVGLLLAAIFFGAEGCKEPVIEDKNLLTGDDDLLLGTADTLTVQSFLLSESPQKSNGVAGGILGSATDPVVGSTFAGFYANFRTTTNNINFGSNLELDSAVLVLKYRGKYGKFTQPIGVSVYEISERITTNEYFTNSSFGVNLPPAGQISNLTPNTTDSIRVYNSKFGPQLRIRLTTDFGNKILLTDTNNLANVNAFQNLIKGLFITPQTGTAGNGFVALDLYSGETGIILYYKNSANDSLSYTFPISSSGQTVNRFEHSFSSTETAKALSNIASESDSILPVQSGGGTKVKISMPQLDSLPKNIAINKAELVLPLADLYSTYDTLFTPPSKISLLRIDDSGLEKADTEFGNGNLETVTINGVKVKRYRVNISIYLQKLLNGTFKNNGLILKAPDANGERFVLSNTSDKNRKIALRIIYTKL